jgi:hypothetical protein
VTYDAASLAASMTVTGGVTPYTLTYTRNANGSETRVDRDTPPGVIQTFYDARNRPFQRGTRTFSWDQFDRLTFTQRGAENLRVMYGSDEPVQTLGTGGTVNYAQRPYTSRPHVFSTFCTSEEDGLDITREVTWSSPGDSVFSAEQAGEVYDLVAGDNLLGGADSRDLAGAWPGAREIGLITGESGSASGRCDWLADGDERECSSLSPYGVGAQLGAEGTCTFELNDGSCVGCGALRDLFLGDDLNVNKRFSDTWSFGAGLETDDWNLLEPAGVGLPCAEDNQCDAPPAGTCLATGLCGQDACDSPTGNAGLPAAADGGLELLAALTLFGERPDSTPARYLIDEWHDSTTLAFVPQQSAATPQGRSRGPCGAAGRVP